MISEKYKYTRLILEVCPHRGFIVMGYSAPSMPFEFLAARSSIEETFDFVAEYLTSPKNGD